MARFRYNSKTRPPTQTTMHILDSDYQYLLEKRDFPNQPAYDILHKILYNQEKLREEFNEAREFLEMAIEDKKQFRIQNEELRQRVKALEEDMKKLKSIMSCVFPFNPGFLLDRYI
jgi:hypothetical protein